MSCKDCEKLNAELSELRGARLEELAALRHLYEHANAERIYYIKECVALTNELTELRGKK